MGALMAAPAMADGRTALVIGNSAYPSAPLKNPVNDAGDMAAALRKLGFEVTLLKDATMQQMEEAVRAFGLRLRQGGAGLFYYAGHGVQVAGENYLVPVNAVIQSEGDVKYGCLNAGLVLAKMEDAGNGPNVVILDACRNNPFARSFRSAAQGLARMDAPTGSLIAYATAPGQVASDGEGRNGLYTQYLLRNIATPGLSIGDLFMNVREGVVRASGKKQVPWENTSLIGRFSLAGPVSPASPAPAVPAQSAPVQAAQPAPAQPVPALKAPTPDEARLLQYMRLAWSAKHEEEREKARALAAPLAAKGSVYGKYALGWLSEDNMAQYQAERQAAAQGVPLAMVHLAETLSDKAVSPDDAVEARDWLKRAMALGEPRAKVALGVMLAKGQGGAKDLAGGTRMLAEAAREHPEFNLLVGVSFGDLEKDGVTDAKARELAYVQRGAELGDVNAMMQMGHNYENGWGVAKNAREAVWWFTKAADTGFPYAMFYLGALLRNGGDKLPADPITAAKWFARGAALGETACTIQLAQMTLEGEGVARDAQKGLGLLRGLADTGNGFAQEQLGQVYEMGRGVPQNPAEAYFWYVVADNSGDMGGAIWRKSLAQKLSPAQRAEIEARAAKWKPRDKKK
jgi:uncharacterized caspase-like protein